MLKAILFTIVFILVFVPLALFVVSLSEDVTKEEGFLYSSIGCTSVFIKLEEADKVDHMLNLIHNYSMRQGIEETQPGYLTRFIKLVEKKWEKENDMAKKNCDGIYELAMKEPQPASYNKVAQSVVEYMLEINAKRDDSDKLPPELEEQLKAYRAANPS